MQEQMASERALANFLQVGDDNTTANTTDMKNQVNALTGQVNADAGSTIKNAQDIANQQAKNTDATTGTAQKGTQDANAKAATALNTNSQAAKMITAYKASSDYTSDDAQISGYD